MRKIMLVLFFLLLGAIPAGAQEVPAELKPILVKAELAINKPDLTELQVICESDAKKLFSWALHPTFEFNKWHVSAIKLPHGNDDDWVAVVWDYHEAEGASDHVYKLSHWKTGWLFSAEIPEQETYGFRIRDHQLEIKFDLAQHRATCADTLTIDRQRADAEVMQLRISADFVIDDIKFNGNDLPFTQCGGILYTIAPAGEHFNLAVRYHGVAAHNNGFIVSNYIGEDEILLTAYWYPIIARLPAANRITATVPKSWSVISQGNLISHSENGNENVFTYRMDLPNSFFSFDAGPYQVYEKTAQNRAYRVYLLKPAADRAEKQLELVDDSFRLFEKLWGQYPYDHYALVETGLNMQGALEAYTFATYGKGLIPSSNPHEWAHTWWGGFAGCTYLEDSWNEVFASYAEDLAYRRDARQPAAQALLDRIYWRRVPANLEKQFPVTALAENRDGPDFASLILSYSKGPLVMQNLEETIGFDRLMKAMRLFREAQPLGETRNWHDFERAVNQVTGEDYHWWFAQWINRPGLPSLHWQNVVMKRENDDYSVEADLTQDGEPYRLNVPVLLITTSGERINSNIAIDSARAHLKMSAKSLPLRLIFDPELRLPRHTTDQEKPFSAAISLSYFEATGATIIARPEYRESAKQLAANIKSAVIKDAAQLTTADLKESNLIFIGDPAPTPLLAEIIKISPFQSNANAVNFHGHAYSHAIARGYTINPLNPVKVIAWFSPSYHPQPDPPTFHQGLPDNSNCEAYAPVLIFDERGLLLDGEAGVCERGDAVYQFK